MSATFAEAAIRSWRIPALCADFVGAMLDAPVSFDVVEFLQTPWKWAPELQAWINAGKPTEQDGETWEEFCEAVYAL